MDDMKKPKRVKHRYLIAILGAISIIVAVLAWFLPVNNIGEAGNNDSTIVGGDFITVDSGSIVIIGDGNIIGDSENSIDSNPMPTQAPYSNLSPANTTFVLHASYRTMPFSLTDINAIIYASTSNEADRVVMEGSKDGELQGTWQMRSDNSINWTFDANFFEVGTYLITITAFSVNGEIASDTIEIKYPDDWN
jgi:hypothetical protein